MEAMFFGRFREAHETHVSFPDDSPHLMDMLIRLAHGDTSGFDHLNAEEKIYLEDGAIDPSSTFADEVYDILVLANKYLMTQKLGPFRSLWINQLKEWEIYITYPEDGVMAPSHLNQLEKYMWMASELGALSLYTSAFPYLIWHRRRDDDLFQSVPEPEGAAGKTQRLQLDFSDDADTTDIRSHTLGLSTGSRGLLGANSQCHKSLGDRH